MDVYLDNNIERNLAYGSAALGALAVFIPEPLVAKVSGAILSIGGIDLNRVNSNGKGIIVTFKFDPITGILAPTAMLMPIRVVSQ